MSESNARDWDARAATLDARIRPIAKRTFDPSDPDLLAKLAAVHPLDAAGVRLEAEALLMELLDAYANGDDSTRAQIRELYHDYDSFAWAATPPVSPSTPQGFRAHLLLFSIDNLSDSRDARLRLDWILDVATRAGIEAEPFLAEVAEISSREDPYGVGSTHDWLLHPR